MPSHWQGDRCTEGIAGRERNISGRTVAEPDGPPTVHRHRPRIRPPPGRLIRGWAKIPERTARTDPTRSCPHSPGGDHPQPVRGEFLPAEDSEFPTDPLKAHTKIRQGACRTALALDQESKQEMLRSQLSSSAPSCLL